MRISISSEYNKTPAPCGCELHLRSSSPGGRLPCLYRHASNRHFCITVPVPPVLDFVSFLHPTPITSSHLPPHQLPQPQTQSSLLLPLLATPRPCPRRPRLARRRRLAMSASRLRAARRVQRVAALAQPAERRGRRCAFFRAGALFERIDVLARRRRCAASQFLSLRRAARTLLWRDCSTHGTHGALERLDAHADQLLLRICHDFPASGRLSARCIVLCEPLLQVALIRVRVDEAENFERDERGGDVGQQEADAGPEGGVDEEGEAGEGCEEGHFEGVVVWRRRLIETRRCGAKLIYTSLTQGAALFLFASETRSRPFLACVCACVCAYRIVRLQCRRSVTSQIPDHSTPKPPRASTPPYTPYHPSLLHAVSSPCWMSHLPWPNLPPRFVLAAAETNQPVSSAILSVWPPCR
jgi:hypothetical protein